MNMSTLIKTEHDNWKKRMIVETCGTYVLMNMGMGFVVIAGAFCGVMNTEFDLYYYIDKPESQPLRTTQEFQ